MKSTNWVSLVVLLVFSLLFAACSPTAPINNSSAEQTSLPADYLKTQYPLKVQDFANQEVNIPQAPTRIVSLSPSLTEILFALGLGDRIVGVTDYDDYPPEVLSLPKVGDFQGPNIETIVRQKPDLIFASILSGNNQMDMLQKLGFPVVMLEATTLNEIYDSIRITAQITNTQPSGQKLIEQMQTGISEIQNKVKDLPQIKTFYLVDANGNWTAGRDTFIDELIILAGGVNIAGDITGWGQFSIEKLVEKNPAVIVTAPHAGDVTDLIKKAGFQNTKAVQNGNIFIISDDNIVTRPSSRIVEGLAELAKYIHPEAFK